MTVLILSLAGLAALTLAFLAGRLTAPKPAPGPVPLPNTEAAHAAVDAVPDADALKRDRERW